jgi:hypothetical protein
VIFKPFVSSTSNFSEHGHYGRLGKFISTHTCDDRPHCFNRWSCFLGRGTYLHHHRIRQRLHWNYIPPNGQCYQHCRMAISQPPRNRDRFETLAYMGPNDPRYVIVVVAAIKTGYKVNECKSRVILLMADKQMFLTSPRNSVAAHQSLFSALNCNTMITTNPEPAPVNKLLEEIPGLKVFRIPSLHELLTASEQKYPFSHDTIHSQDPIFVLHTSGSTGNML